MSDGEEVGKELLAFLKELENALIVTRDVGLDVVRNKDPSKRAQFESSLIRAARGVDNLHRFFEKYQAYMNLLPQHMPDIKTKIHALLDDAETTVLLGAAWNFCNHVAPESKEIGKMESFARMLTTFN